KLQYPEMQSAVEADLNQLRIALAIYKRMDTAIDTSEIAQEIAARLREELDYGLEACHMALYALMLRGDEAIRVPELLPELSTKRLLTMTWLDGQKLLDYGCIRTFEPKFVGGVMDLYHGLRDKNRDLIVHAYEIWGFRGLSNDLIDILNIWAGFIYGPLLDDRVRLVADGV